MGIIMGCLALAIDGSNTFLQRRQAQEAADAGAMAGAYALALGENAAAAAGAATEYATDRNTATSADITVTGGQTVTIVARNSFPTFFGAVIGQRSLEVGARAGAKVAPVTAVREGVFPIAVNWNDLEYNTPYDLFAGAGPGNFGWLGWIGSTDTDSLCASLTGEGNSETYTNPYDSSDHILSVGNMIPGSTGVANAACIQNALQTLIASETPIIVPVWDQAQGSGDGLEYRLAGFAEFVVMDYQLPGQNRITGYFKRDVILGDGVGTGSGFGVYRVIPTE